MISIFKAFLTDDTGGILLTIKTLEGNVSVAKNLATNRLIVA